MIARVSLPWILGIGFLLRLLFLFQSRHDVLSTHLVIDAQFYDQWARKIASGDWLGTTVFYQDPLYAYFLAVAYKIFGHSLTAVRLLQAALDTATIALLFTLTARLFGRPAGLVAAAMTALMSPLVYYVGLLDKTTVSVFLIALALTLLAEALARERRALFAAAGAAFGLAALARGNMLLAAAALAAWLLFRRLKDALAFGLGVGLVVGAVAARNIAVGRDHVLITANPGLNFFIGNNPYTIGQYIEPPFIRGIPEYESDDAKAAAEQFSGQKMEKPSEVSRYWFREGARFIVRAPRQWLALSGRKLFLAFHDFEIGETYTYDYFRSHYGSLALPFLTFGLIAPLGLLGAAWTLLRRRPNVLHLYLLVYLLSLIAFFVTSRYRTPLLVGLIPFAASFAVEAWAAPRALPPLAPLFFLVFWRPAWFEERVARPTLATAHMVAGHVDTEIGDLDGATREIQAAIRANPRAPSGYAYLAQVYSNRGDAAAALAQYREALTLDPRLDDVWENVGILFFNAKDYRQAAAAFENAARLRPQEELYRKNLALARKAANGRR